MEYFLENASAISVRIYDDFNNIKSKKLIRIHEYPHIYQSINQNFYNMSVPINKDTRFYVEIENSIYNFKSNMCYINMLSDMKKKKLKNMDYYKLSESFIEISKDIDNKKVKILFRFYKHDDTNIILTTPVVEVH